MRKHFRIINLLVKLNLQKELMYRTNAVFTFIAANSYILTFVLTLNYLYDNINTLGGYRYDQIFTLLMLGQLWWYAHVLVVRKSLQAIAKAINDGSFDMFLTKPFAYRSILPFWQFDFRHIPPMLVVLVLIFWQLDVTQLSLLQVVGGTLFFINGVAISYLFTSIFVAFNFWVGRNYTIFDITIEMPDMMRIPVEFFPLALQGVFTFLIPITVTVNPTFQIIYGNVNPVLLIVAVLVTGFLFFLNEFIWRTGLKAYTSAN